MNIQELSCGFTWIPYIFKGTENRALSAQHYEVAKQSMDKLQHDRQSHRLSENYRYDQLHLDMMYTYSIVYDHKINLPVYATGVQIVGSNSARVLSRYFVFPEYRTLSESSEMLEKSDNFEALSHEIEVTAQDFPFLFMSRKNGVKFFEKIKNRRPDIFLNWIVYQPKIELMFKDNYQGIMYLNRSPMTAESLIQNDLTYRPKKAIDFNNIRGQARQ